MPIWTGIMRSTFKRGREIASSAPVESEFSSLKTTFRQLLHVDKFILFHIEYLNQKVRLSAADGKKSKKTIEREKVQKVLSHLEKRKIHVSSTAPTMHDLEIDKNLKSPNISSSDFIIGPHNDLTNNAKTSFDSDEHHEGKAHNMNKNLVLKS